MFVPERRAGLTQTVQVVFLATLGIRRARLLDIHLRVPALRPRRLALAAVQPSLENNSLEFAEEVSVGLPIAVGKYPFAAVNGLPVCRQQFDQFLVDLD